MATSSLVVALAGGAGVAIGTIIGQVIQWWRETVSNRLADRRRNEDQESARIVGRQERRREAMLSVAGAVYDAESIVSALRDTAHRIVMFEHRPVPIFDVEFRDEWNRDVATAIGHLRAAAKVAALYGPDDLSRALDLLLVTASTIQLKEIASSGASLVDQVCMSIYEQSLNQTLYKEYDGHDFSGDTFMAW